MSPALPHRFDLGRFLARRWLVVGVGNDLRGDDGFGPDLARRLRALGLPALDGGACPENLTGPILATSPQVLILADCADHGGQPGEVALLPACRAGGGGPSTHGPGLGPLLSYLRSVRPDLEAWLLVVQPARLGFGDSLSHRVRVALARLVREFAALRDGGSPAATREGIIDPPR